jgi:hypothetical protein
VDSESAQGIGGMRRYGPLGIVSVFIVVAVLVACSRSRPPIGAAPGPASSDDPISQCCGPLLSKLEAESEAGWWVGTISRNGEVVHQTNCLVTDAGELACELYAATYAGELRDDPVLGIRGVPETVTGGARGTLELSGAGQPIGSGRLYAAPGRALSDGTSLVADFTIVGGSLSDDRRRLDLMLDSLGEVSTFSGTFDPYYYEVTGLTPGVYTDFDVFGDPASLSIDTDGALFSQSETGCVPLDRPITQEL